MKKQRKRMKNPRIRSDGYAKDIVYSLEIDRIRANTAQPRRDFDVESIIKLADSIRRYGILQPLSVRRVDANESSEPTHHESHKRINLVADLLSASLGASPGSESSTQIGSFTEPIMEGPSTPKGIWFSREKQADGALQLRIPDDTPSIHVHYGGEKQQEEENLSLRFPELPLLELTPSGTATDRSRSIYLPNDTCQYELVAGERRLRAAKMLGMRYVPCIIIDVNDAISAELALVENMLRENLNMFEQAAAFSHLADKYSFTQEEIAAKMSLSQSAVANKIRLLKLSESERQLIMEAGLTERHARAFLRVSDPNLREGCIQYVIDQKLNVSDTDKYISALLTQSNRPTPKKSVELPSPEKLCNNIYKFINRMQSASGNYLIVNRRSDDKNVVITLTVRKGS